MEYEAYLYGMTLISNSYLLKEKFPDKDDYAEITETYKLPGGETGTCATVLSSLGISSRIDGNHQGVNTYKGIVEFYEKLKVDTSRLFLNKSFHGLEDHVFIDKTSRTCFGRFQEYFSNQENKKWNIPQPEDILNARVIGLDPFFYDESVLVAEYCKNYNKKYVTIDCKYDSVIHKYSYVNIISNEFIRNNYQGEDINDLFHKYVQNSDGLVIFTFGAREIFYGRKESGLNKFIPYKVEVKSTLGAGDSFKAGAVYGAAKDMDDYGIVDFAAATAAIACCNFPIPLNPPTLDEISKLRNTRK